MTPYEEVRDWARLFLQHERQSGIATTLQSIQEAVSKAVHTEIEGVVDFVSSTDVFLSDVDEMYGSEASFGSYVYMTPRLSNAKITKLSPKVNKTSEEVIVEYYNELKHG